MATPATTPEKPKGARPSRWHLPLWWANGLAVLVLLLTYLAPHLSPRNYWILALLAMTYPFQLLVHAGFLLYWGLFRRKRMLLSMGALILGWGHVGDHVQLSGRNAPASDPQGDGVKVMSFNVRVFDLYDWTGNKVSRDAIMDLIKREDAGILCLQEFFDAKNKPYFENRKELTRTHGLAHVHDNYNVTTKRGHRFGIATFSKFPIVAKGQIRFAENANNQCIWSDIDLGHDTIRVYNAHLASYHFGDAEYRFLNDLDTDTPKDTLRRGGLRILKRLRRGFRLRASEVEGIAEHMRESPHPVVYCGDMNDVPMSYGYGLFRDRLEDAFVESGSGMGGTYIGRLPSFRIDHILHSPELESWSFTTHPEQLSDHRAISCFIAPVR
jgi:endonuclease/exonuclease/phosphatase family metal-dependent hydrolase